MSVNNRNKKSGYIIAGISALLAVVTALSNIRKRTTYKSDIMVPISQRTQGLYEKYIKRMLDIFFSLILIIVFLPVYMIIALLVRIKLGSPVIFSQYRPGTIDEDGRETIFKIYKFRTMTNASDENGILLPDNKRMTSFGKWLRSTSLDELPELFNILLGTMSFVGPRPQLVKDLAFMTGEQRIRHTARPGLTGLAQVKGRNLISWEEKLSWDLKYISDISFALDVKIILMTIKKAFYTREGITEKNSATATDLGDYLLGRGLTDDYNYQKHIKMASDILKRRTDAAYRDDSLVSVIMPSYNTEKYIADSVISVLNQTYTNLELIIVDDASDDNTVNIIKSFDDARIRLYVNKANTGAAFCRNFALKKARGRWIAFLDSDDLWRPDKLEKQLRFMKDNNYHFTYTCYEEIDDMGKQTGKIIYGPHKITETGFYNYCWPGCLTVMYDRYIVGDIRIRNIKKNNDYAMWLKVARYTDCYLLNENLAYYRRSRSGSISTDRYLNLIKFHYILFRQAESQSVLSSLLNVIRNMFFGIYKKIRYVRHYK